MNGEEQSMIIKGSISAAALAMKLREMAFTGDSKDIMEIGIGELLIIQHQMVSIAVGVCGKEDSVLNKSFDFRESVREILINDLLLAMQDLNFTEEDIETACDNIIESRIFEA